MQTHWKLAAGALATAAAAGMPAATAAAQTAPRLAKAPFAITTSMPFGACYDAGESFTVPLSGGNPGDDYEVQLSEGSKIVASEDGAASGFDSNGNGAVTLSRIDPDFSTDNPIAGVPITASVVDYPADGGAQTTSTIGTFKMTQLAYAFSSKPSNPGLPRSFAFSGAFPNANDWGFVVNSKGTRVLRKFHIGRSNVCGYIKSKAVIAPAGAARGTYRFYVYPGPKLRTRGVFFAKFSITRR